MKIDAILLLLVSILYTLSDGWANMNFEQAIFFPLLLVMGAFLIVPFLSVQRKATATLIIVLINAVLTSFPAVNCLSVGEINQTQVYAGATFGDVVIKIDALSSWFILIVNFTCITGTLYGAYYLKAYSTRPNRLTMHWLCLLVFHFSMICVCCVQHTLAFLVVWEVMSLSSFLLVMFEHTTASTVRAGINYLVQMHICAALLVLALIAISTESLFFNFDQIANVLLTKNSDWIVVALLIGFGIKAGFVPFHTWLPHAHPAAPSHVSGMMSGVIVKMGIYGILRTLTYVNTNLVTLGVVVLIVAMATTFYGILNGAIHNDIKKVLAFCTIENIGIIGMGIGTGLVGKGLGNSTIMALGFSSSLIHSLNHSLYKSLLFYATGNVYSQTHTRNMEQLGGLIKKMPVTALLFLTGSLAISGLPPFNGFVSKFLTMVSFIEGIRGANDQIAILFMLAIIILALAGGLSLITFAKSFGIVFLGVQRSAKVNAADEVPKYGLAPLVGIVTCMLLIGLFPSVLIHPIEQVLKVFKSNQAHVLTLTMMTESLTTGGYFSGTAILVILSVIFLRNLLIRQRAVSYASTWACGYVSSAQMQYTGKSFSNTLAKLLHFITQEEKKYLEIENNNVFPTARSYRSTYIEFFEKNILDKIRKSFLGFLSYFSFVHNGRIQMYILYGFFFILFLFVATIFNLI